MRGRPWPLWGPRGVSSSFSAGVGLSVLASWVSVFPLPWLQGPLGLGGEYLHLAQLHLVCGEQGLQWGLIVGEWLGRPPRGSGCRPGRYRWLSLALPPADFSVTKLLPQSLNASHYRFPAQGHSYIELSQEALRGPGERLPGRVCHGEHGPACPGPLQQCLPWPGALTQAAWGQHCPLLAGSCAPHFPLPLAAPRALPCCPWGSPEVSLPASASPMFSSWHLLSVA